MVDYEDIREEAGSQEIVASIIAQYPDPTGRLINVLNDLQERYRYLPESMLDEVATQLSVDRDQLNRMADFFDRLSLVRVGRCVVEVCDGTACHSQGSMRLVREMERLLGVKAGATTPDGLITLKTVACVGACSLAPVVILDQQAYGRVRIQSVSALVAEAMAHAENNCAADKDERREKAGE